MEYGLFTAEFRLPTEAEWEYAASVRKSDRVYNNSQGRNRYPWGSDEVRTNSRRTKGDYLANFKQGRGDYGGIAGRSEERRVGKEWRCRAWAYPCKKSQ